jgi:type VI secretion system VgrG family protein
VASPVDSLGSLASGAVDQLESALGSLLDAATRLYRLDGEGELAGLQVEAFVVEESLSQPWRLELVALHEQSDLDLDAMLAQPATLVTVLADGSEHRRSGLVLQAAAEDSDGGFARYRLVVQPWLGFLAQTVRSRVWQEQNVTAIVEAVLGGYAAYGSWRWSPCAGQLLAGATEGGVRSYCVQYRESDLDFVSRLLAEEGIGYRFEESADGTPGPTVVFFADSTAADSCPENVASSSAAGGTGIRFHRDGVQEEQDTIQVFGGVRGQPVATLSAVSYDYKTGRVISASVPTVGSVGGANALMLEAYDSTQGYAFADAGQAERSLRLKQQALEARHKRWIGRGVVRSFEAGTTFTLAESMLDMLDAIAPDKDKRFLLTRVTHVGVNNLPKDLSDTLTRKADKSESGAAVLPHWVDETLRRRAADRGYANGFEGIRASVPWRPLLADESGARTSVRPRVAGPLIATVVGPDGGTSPQGNQEVHVDALHRVRIRYEFQDADDQGAPASTWVRVQQPLAGNGTGMSFIPRIGHEVLVGFFDDDIERPYVMCSLYNGRGEGGEAVTPGGADAQDIDASVYGLSGDASPGAQGNLAGGNSPAWHGGSAGELDQGGQRNAAALSGYKTKEFGGDGFNQLVFDDSTAQLRVQLATTQHATQLNLGHLIHQADNHRGSFRGVGFELRTDAYGAVRGGQGVLLTTFGASAGEPAGDNAAGIALAKQWSTLATAFNAAASTHRTVQLSGVIGPAQANQSALDGKASPIAAWVTQTSGMVSTKAFDGGQADAGNKSTSTASGNVPHGTDAVVNVSARGGLAMTSGQDTAFVSEENVQFASGADTDVAAGGALRLHTGQAIGILGGAIKAGDKAVGTGLTMIAGAGDVDVQAQAGTLQVAALNDLKIQSQSDDVNWASARKITLSTAGGASIVIEGGNVTVMCPGTITVHAGTKSFVSSSNAPTQLPTMPRGTLQFDEEFQLVDATGDALANMRVEITNPNGDSMLVVSDGQGKIPLRQGFSPDRLSIRVVGRASGVAA